MDYRHYMILDKILFYHLTIQTFDDDNLLQFLTHDLADAKHKRVF